MSTHSPSEIPERVFTSCALPLRYRGVYIRAEDPWIGFIFVKRDGSLCFDDLDQISRDRTLREVMGNFFMMGPIQWNTHDREPWGDDHFDHWSDDGQNQGIYVSQRPIYMPDCRRHPRTPLWVFVDGITHKFTVEHMYRECTRLHRLMGCWRCPDAGEACLTAHLKIPWPQVPLPGLGDPHIDLDSDNFQEFLRREQMTWSWAKDTFRPWKDQVAGYTYIPPQLASQQPTRPGENVNKPYQLDFHGLDEAREALSNRSKAGIETRRTLRTQCTECFFGGTGYKGSALPCDKYRPRNCPHGAWTEEQVMNATLPPFKAGLESAGFTMRQFEQTLAIAGQPFRRPTEQGGYAKWIVTKLHLERHSPATNGWRGKVLLKRVARDHRDTWEYLDDLHTLWKMLPPDLRRIFDEAPILPESTLAVAAHMSVCHTIKPYICMQGCIREVCPDISHVRVRWPHQVEVGYWTVTYWRDMSFSGLESVASYFNGTLPGFSLSKYKEGDEFRFHVYPRQSGIWG
jgi:hypothetical protein